MTQVFNQVSLVETTKDEATQATSFDNLRKQLASNQSPRKLKYGYLPANSKNIYSLGDAVTAYSTDETPISFTINQVNVLDNISQLNQSNFNPTFIEYLREQKLLSDDGALLSFKQKVI